MTDCNVPTVHSITGVRLLTGTIIMAVINLCFDCNVPSLPLLPMTAHVSNVCSLGRSLELDFAVAMWRVRAMTGTHCVVAQV